MSPSWLVVSQRTVVCWGLKKVTWLRTWLVRRASVTLVWMLSSSGSALSCCHKLVWLLHLQRRVGPMQQVGVEQEYLWVLSPLVSGPQHFTGNGQTHLSMLSQLYHWMVGVGTPSATHVTNCFFPGRWWSVRSLIRARTTDTGGNMGCYPTEHHQTWNIKGLGLVLNLEELQFPSLNNAELKRKRLWSNQSWHQSCVTALLLPAQMRQPEALLLHRWLK